MGTPATLACLLLLLHLTAGISSKTYYVVVIPTELYHPHKGMMWVHLANFNETVLVTLQLERQSPSSNISLLEKKVKEPNLTESVSFLVPAPTTSGEEVAHLHISIEGDSLKFSERKKVLLKALEPGTFVQTDKPIYKPGQTVNFRIVSLDKDFVPSNKKVPLVTLQDPNGNRIAQWRDVAPQQGIVDLSLPLSAEPALGTYSIDVEGTKHSFSVEEYVLPKFEVTLELPPVVTVLKETLEVRVCGQYTYGKPVQGTVQISLCQKAWRFRFSRNEAQQLCMEFTGQTEKNGCFSKKVSMSHFNLTSSGYRTNLQATASLTEEGTGVERNVTKSCWIVSDIVSVTFEKADASYKPGIPFVGKLLLKVTDSSSVKNEKLHLFVTHGGGTENKTFVTDESGRASFELDSSSWTGTVTLRGQFKEVDHSYVRGRVSPQYRDAYHSLEPFYSESKSFLKIHAQGEVLPCDQTQQLQVEYIIARKALGAETKSLDFYFLVVAKGAIIRSLWKGLDFGEGAELKGSFSTELPVGAELAPSAKVLGYTVLPSGEMVADSTELHMTKCFLNKVKLAFSQDRALPGSELHLQVQASPGSLCAVRAVDQSVLLMKPEAELSVDTVYNLLPRFPKGSYPYKAQDPDTHCPGPFWRPSMRVPIGSAFGRRDNLRQPSKRAVNPENCLVRPFPPPESDMSEPMILLPLSRPWPPRRRPPPFGYQLPSLQSHSDTYSLFQNAGLKVATNTNIRMPCLTEEFIPVRETYKHYKGPAGPLLTGERRSRERIRVGMGSRAPENSLDNVMPEPIIHEEPAPRAYFPETWLWDLVPVGEEGSNNVPVTVPDSITEWKAGMFCTADVGFGLSSTATLTAFKPFFVELALPYSVIRGEAFTLKATVFNYLLQCIKVQVTLVESTQVQAQAGEDSAYTSCLCAEEGKTFQWEVTATSFGEVNFTVSTEALHTQELCGNEVVIAPAQGRVDTVIKPLLVQPGGILEEKAHSSLLCQEVSENISLAIPGNIVAGSERAHVTVLGDMMGAALQNIDRLLAMPHGCGEQNMVRFAPNIYIQQYLEKSGQLTPEIRDKAQGFLKSGYQRELKYKHDDGSYSAFGKSDATGNTWLTAFVVKCFGQARPYIFIDQQHIEDALKWLQQHQMESGCFQSVGKLLNNALQGGISNELSLSAYITAALLELGLPLMDPMMSKALQCLHKSSNTTDIYTQALLAYSFGLAGDMQLWSALLKSLAQYSTSSGGQLHWERKVKPPPGTDSFWAQALSAEVEMTAYVLLAYLSPPKEATADLATASQIVRWLSKQQNPYGGFASTQDTVVALQALAKYAALTYSVSGDMTVTVKSQGSFQQEFHVDNTNRLVLQQATLPQIPGEYTVMTQGQGCALVQLTLRYNLPPKSTTTFDLRVETDPKECTGNARTHFSLILHARYSGERSATNMAILEVKLPSGYLPDKKSVRKLENEGLVKKLELSADEVILYLDQLTKEETTFTFSVEQDFPVKNLKPATVRLYDYYEMGEHTEADYSAPCSSAPGTEEGNSR
ncbi:alpha-2-macroglobulin-like protein 1 [Alligator mississippiensis]|uniref:alpha-2-macroglobulin-like protein 1 n=1 Tax=Alligator mississippiensis TaxID=8496 RepID=UPI002877905F|nr:alpha-2-macroglobulin-like protein 1 [Alligator mississippiensis]